MSRGKERLTAQLVPSPRMASPFMTTTPAQSRGSRTGMPAVEDT